jgi:hypothetical protein
VWVGVAAAGAGEQLLRLWSLLLLLLLPGRLLILRVVYVYTCEVADQCMTLFQAYVCLALLHAQAQATPGSPQQADHTGAAYCHHQLQGALELAGQ